MPATSDLDVYEIAYLAGGVPRVVDTALVALVETGRIRVPAPGRLVVADTALRRHPVEAAVLDAVGTRGHRSVDVIRWRLTGDDRIDGIGRRLTDQGLVSRWTRVLRRGDRPPLLTSAGRRALHARARDGGSAVQVALNGRKDISGASIFEPLVPVQSARERAAGLRRRIDASRPGPFFARESPGGTVGGGGDGGGG